MSFTGYPKLGLIKQKYVQYVQIIERKKQHMLQRIVMDGQQMHLGRLKNEAFIKAYKQYGFSTITQLVDVACEDLKRKIAQERRAKWRQKAHEEYVEYVSFYG